MLSRLSQGNKWSESSVNIQNIFLIHLNDCHLVMMPRFFMIVFVLMMKMDVAC